MATSEPNANETSLSMIPSPPVSGGMALPPYSMEGPPENTPGKMLGDCSLDFVGSSAAVKDLFSLPYTYQEQTVSVAIHNVDGTLIFDQDPQAECRPKDYNPQQKHHSQATKRTLVSKNKTRPLPGKKPIRLKGDKEKDVSSSVSSQEEVSQALVTLSNLAPVTGATTNNNNNNNNKSRSDSLSVVNSFLDASDSLSVVNSFLDAIENQNRRTPLEENSTENEGSVSALGLPRPDHYVSVHIPPTPEPREYLTWKFHDMNLLVGSDALILRGKDERSNTILSQTVRVEDADTMRALVKRHEHAVRSGSFKADHQFSLLQQRGKPSYASAVAKNNAKPRIKSQEEKEKDPSENPGFQSSGFSAPNLDEVQLQTCIVPCPTVPVGGLLDDSDSTKGLSETSANGQKSDERAKMGPVSTVLDAYLDNLLANVPQLALCLAEKGFVQSVKLLETESIPSTFLHPSTADTSKIFDISTEESDRVFSPQVMEMNATALLRFLKLNCSKDNSTYLLRRERGQTNVHLYDISSISAKKQRKWVWWLAMMSSRFAQRLRNISGHTTDPALRRSFRNRERGLLQNALDLLECIEDMDGTSHESLAAGLRENLANTFLRGEEEPGAVVLAEGLINHENAHPVTPEPATSKSSSQQPYASITVDALNKAHDHLSRAIKCLYPLFEERVSSSLNNSRGSKKKTAPEEPSVVSIDGNSSDDSDDEVDRSDCDLEVIAAATQLFGLHEKIVNVSLRLAEGHLRNYYSSSAMQALRTAARRIANSLYILKILSGVDNNIERDRGWLQHVQLQYVWLWEHCGHFARSFASDGLWRDRGHAAADDILSVLVDAENAFTGEDHLLPNDSTGLDMGIFLSPSPLSSKTGHAVSLHSLSGIVVLEHAGGKTRRCTNDGDSGVGEARKIIDRQKFLQREERKVIIAACLAYQRAINAFKQLEKAGSSGHTPQTDDATFLALLQQRLGDACNEAGKILMDELKSQLTNPKEGDAPSNSAARALLSSAEFWFNEGLDAFEQSHDLRNLVLLRCNLCQCFKLRANALFSEKDSKDRSVHSEKCLQEAANQLEAAHEALGERGTDPVLWDMVSAELAATFLVLGVRRRQSLIGAGNTPVLLQSLRLSPGEERSIVEPMERALTIYESNGNFHQSAAAHYQLALFFSKVWTCQRDETKTREKLGAAFKHYNAALGYFGQAAFEGNEITFCLVCLDLSSLYSSVQGEEGNAKALLCCLDTMKALAVAKEPPVIPRTEDWYVQMDTVAASVEDRVFKSLRSLVKRFDDGETKIPYRDIYRTSLRAKMMVPKPKDSGGRDLIMERLSGVCDILKATDDELTKLGLK